MFAGHTGSTAPSCEANTMRVPRSPLAFCVLAVDLLLGLSCGEPEPKPRTPTHRTPPTDLVAPRVGEVVVPVVPPEGPGGAGAVVAGPPSLSIHEVTIDGLEPLIARAIARGELPGCVVAVGDRAGVRLLEAYGERTAGEPMTVDTRFDLASLTKPVVTAASIMALVEGGQLDLEQSAATYLPELGASDKRHIGLSMLLLHTSGLPSINRLDHYEQGNAHAIAEIAREPLESAPGSAFRYSDLGFILLGEIVARTTGSSLAQYADQRVLGPLGMHDTLFAPPAGDAARTAPTEERDDVLIRGVVDDPRAYRLGGIAGHAGLFSTASDLARFARMLLGEGQLDGVRVLSADTVRTWITPRPPGRALGFDVASGYALGKGSLFSARAFGHGGYTGTSLWIDPERDLFVILLSNRVHAGPRGSIHPLTRNVGDLAAHAVDEERRPTQGLATGIDLVEAEAFARVRGPNVALLTHTAASNRQDRSTLESLIHAPGVKVHTIFAPEHGLDSRREGHVEDTRYGTNGIAVHSLFGRRRRPTPRMLAGVELVVIDLVDVGTRFYTYMATALATLEAAAEARLPVMVLDRPNPIDGVHIEGPLSEPAFASFVNYHPLPLRHGMTSGELLRWLARERNVDVKLEVVRMKGYRRDMLFADTGLTWHAPSPNLRRPGQALLYPGVALIEGTNVSVGRGTGDAFEVVGAPFLDAVRLRDALEAEHIPGLRVTTTTFTPRVGPHARTRLSGVRFEVDEPRTFEAAPLGLALAQALLTIAPAHWDATRLDPMIAHASTLAGIRAARRPSDLVSEWRAELETFEHTRRMALLY